MDGTHFDTLLRGLTATRSRRGTVVGLLGGVFGLLGRGAAEAKHHKKKHKKHKSRTCKPSCGACAQCDKGTCRSEPNGTACGAGQTCQDGVCASVSTGGCGPGQKPCGAGCVPNDACCHDDEPCNGDGRCLTGVCRPRPACLPNGTTFSQASDSRCCSQNVSCDLGPTEVVCTCMPASPRDDCLSDSDCAVGTCVGYRCRSCTGAACGPSYRFERAIGSHGSGAVQFDLIQQLTMNHAGNLLVADTFNHRVQEITTDGTFVRQFGVTGVAGSDNQHLNNPTGVAVDQSDNVYIADENNRRVQKFSPAGAWLYTFGVTGVRGSDNQHFDLPQYLAIDSRQRLYVADYDNNRVQAFQTDGTFVGTLAHPDARQVDLVAVDGHDHVFAHGEVLPEHTEVEFDANGQFVRTWDLGGGSLSTAFSSDGSMFVGQAAVDSVDFYVAYQYTPDGKYIRTIEPATEPGARADQVYGPVGFAFDREGNVYISDRGGFRTDTEFRGWNDRIVKYAVVPRVSGAAKSEQHRRGEREHRKTRSPKKRSHK
jgi:hypothetical protein